MKGLSTMADEKSERRYDLESRLINFAVICLDVVDKLPKSLGAQTLARQLSKSGTSPALNYGEAQAAESNRDFLHKIKICLKELRESQICLQIILRKSYLDSETVGPAMREASELVAIFTKSVQTTKGKIASKAKGKM